MSGLHTLKMANKIDIKTVDEIAHLARLDFNDASKTEILNDLNRMLAWVDKLNELDTENVEPLIYMTEEKNILREDEPEITISQKEALKNAPKKDSDYFKVPKVIDQQ
jgi:aspartyl-tRNA(Asn)/glutamyl-tRNA(Gln) amidotransferase subunit C